MKRDKTGRFIPNWHQDVKHAVNLSLTQTAWQLLEKQAQQQGISRSELVEYFARNLIPIQHTPANFNGHHPGNETTIEPSMAGLLKEQEFLQVLLDNVQAGIVACNANGEIKLFNQVARSFHGLPEQPLLPEEWANYYNLYLPDGETPMGIEDIPLFRALQGESVQQAEMMIIPKQGVPRTLLANAEAIITPEGKKLGAVVVMHDITERKQMEIVLRDRETQMQSIFQTIPDGIVIVDRSGQITAANPAAEAILKLKRSDITERVYNDPSWAITTLEGAPFPEKELPFVRVMATGKPVYGVEHRITHTDGTTIILSINASPLVDASGEITNIVTALSDITDRKQADAALRESEERYRSVIETAAEGIIFQYADGEIFTCNASAEQILGLTAEQLMGRTSLDPRWRAIHEDGSPFPGEAHPAMMTLQTGEPQSNVTMGIHKPDGTLTWISVNTRPLFHPQDNQPFAVVASFFDITERKQAEAQQAILIREQAARLAAEKAADRMARLQNIMAALSESLTPQQVADVIVAQSMAALSADSALMTVLTDDQRELEIIKAVGYHSDVVESWRRFPVSASVPLADAVRTGTPVWAETKAERLTRYPHLAEVYSRYDFNSWISLPLMIEGKAVGGMLLSFKEYKPLSQEDRDFMLAVSRQCAQAISRAQAYEAERKAREEAEAANRIKDEFLAVLSHELRSPLNPILGWSRLLQTKKLDEAKVSAALQTIERNARLQSELIEDLLDVSRILRGKLSLNRAAVDLAATIHAAIDTVRLSAEAKGIYIETQLATDLGPALGDASRLQQVVWNLLSNAVKFTPEGGRVHVQLESVGSSAQIIVSDTGKGIAPEFLPHVFEYFRQADATTTRQFGGLGLGLAIVRHLVELHGGTIRVNSSGEGQGATFTVQLPLMAKLPSAPTTAITSTHLPSLHGIKVLVVDDDTDARELVAFLLEHEQATVMTAASAPEALNTLAEFHPDILLSDIGMPDVDGYMLMQQVRSLSPEQGGLIPAIALTAYAGEYDQKQALEVGFQKHLPKPVDSEALIQAIYEHIYPSH